MPSLYYRLPSLVTLLLVLASSSLPPLAAAASLAIISWAVTALAFGLVCKEIISGGHRGKRLARNFELDYLAWFQ
ncbi:hypothetical protein SCA6_016995 [Theobroma cacao]